MVAGLLLVVWLLFRWELFAINDLFVWKDLLFGLFVKHQKLKNKDEEK
jgi:hypothetical protein